MKHADGREGRQFHISPFTFRLLLFAAVIVCALILGLIAQIPVNYRQKQLLTARLSEQEKTIRALEEEKEALSSENKALARENDLYGRRTLYFSQYSYGRQSHCGR